MYPRGRVEVVERSGVHEADLGSPRYTPALLDPLSIYIRAWRRRSPPGPSQYPGEVIWRGKVQLIVIHGGGWRGRGSSRWSGRSPQVQCDIACRWDRRGLRRSSCGGTSRRQLPGHHSQPAFWHESWFWWWLVDRAEWRTNGGRVYRGGGCSSRSESLDILQWGRWNDWCWVAFYWSFSKRLFPSAWVSAVKGMVGGDCPGGVAIGG